MNKNDISSNLSETLSELQKRLCRTAELNITSAHICGQRIAVASIEGMVSTQQLTEEVLRPLSELERTGISEGSSLFGYITGSIFLTADRQLVYSLDTASQLLFSGFAVIFSDGECRACALGLQGYEMRSVSTPEAEPTVKCSQDSFTETVRVNMSLVRRRLKTPKLVMDIKQVGKLSKTDVCIMYIKDRAPADIVEKTEKRLSEIELDVMLTSGYAEPFIDDSFGESLFSSCIYTERPDLVCTRLMQGRVCIIVDGTPFALILPSLFAECFSTMDDYSSKPFYSTFIRWIRYISFFLAVGFPGLYVALADHHPEVFSMKLLLNLSAAEEATPYPLMAEVIMLMIFFEIMREAGLRLPKAVGSAVSIVGGLFIGDAAVKSGIVSAPLLIVVGITATASFVNPQLEQPSAVLRLLFILAGGFAGLFGIAVCLAAVTVNICAMDDYAVSYTAPAAPLYPSSLRDILFMKSFKEYEKTRTTLSSIREGEHD